MLQQEHHVASLEMYNGLFYKGDARLFFLVSCKGNRPKVPVKSLQYVLVTVSWAWWKELKE